jgi:hypothetical protein
LAAAKTFHFTVRISRGATTRRCGTLQLAKIILRAMSHATLDVPILIRHRAASLLGTEDLAVLIRRALPFAAHYISIPVLDAIRGNGMGADGQAQKATNEEYIFHRASFDSQTILT